MMISRYFFQMTVRYMITTMMKAGTRISINIKAGILCIIHLNFGGSQSIFSQYAPNSESKEC